MRLVQWKNLVGILVGAAIMGFGLNAINLANNLAEGGVTGIAILLKLAFDWDPGLITLVINIPLFVIGAKILGRTALLHTIFGTVALSFFLWVFGSYRVFISDGLLAALFAGVCVGAGLGLIFRYGGTTGGVDIVARIVQKYFGWSMGRTLFVADIAVLALSLVYLSVQQVMYTAVAVFVGSRIIDAVQDAAYAARAVLIISERGNEISRDILEHMGRGATILHGTGAYTGKEKPVLYVVVGRSEVARLKALILARDPLAFVAVSDAKEVVGEGFSREKSAGSLGRGDAKACSQSVR